MIFIGLDERLWKVRTTARELGWSNERGWNTHLSIELKINLEITLGPRVNESNLTEICHSSLAERKSR